MAFPATTPTGMMGYTMVSRNYCITHSISVRSIISSTPVYSETAVMLSVRTGVVWVVQNTIKGSLVLQAPLHWVQVNDTETFFFSVLFIMFAGFSALLSPPWALSFKKKKMGIIECFSHVLFQCKTWMVLCLFTYLLSMSGNQCYNSGVAPYFIHNYTLTFIFNKTI